MNEQFVAIRVNKAIISSSVFDHNEFISKSPTARHFARNGVRYTVVVIGKGGISDERVKRILRGIESSVKEKHPDWYVQA